MRTSRFGAIAFISVSAASFALANDTVSLSRNSVAAALRLRGIPSLARLLATAGSDSNDNDIDLDDKDNVLFDDDVAPAAIAGSDVRDRRGTCLRRTRSVVTGLCRAATAVDAEDVVETNSNVDNDKDGDALTAETARTLLALELARCELAWTSQQLPPACDLKHLIPGAAERWPGRSSVADVLRAATTTPGSLQSHPDGDGAWNAAGLRVNSSGIATCVDSVLHAPPQLWTSFSGSLRDVATACAVAEYADHKSSVVALHADVVELHVLLRDTIRDELRAVRESATQLRAEHDAQAARAADVLARAANEWDATLAASARRADAELQATLAALREAMKSWTGLVDDDKEGNDNVSDVDILFNHIGHTASLRDVLAYALPRQVELVVQQSIEQALARQIALVEPRMAILVDTFATELTAAGLRFDDAVESATTGFQTRVETAARSTESLLQGLLTRVWNSVMWCVWGGVLVVATPAVVSLIVVTCSALGATFRSVAFIAMHCVSIFTALFRLVSTFCSTIQSRTKSSTKKVDGETHDDCNSDNSNNNSDNDDSLGSSDATWFDDNNDSEDNNEDEEDEISVASSASGDILE